MLNRLKEITLFKVKFPLNIRGVSYIILLHCFFFQTHANQLICSSVFSRLSLFGTKKNANTNTLN